MSTDTPPSDILAMGEAMIEFNQTRGGDGRSYLQGFGGDTSNFAIAARRQGARVGYVSALGDDAFGAMLRDLWRAEGVDDSLVATDPAGFTAAYFVTHGPAGHAFSFLRRGSAAARMAPAAVPTAAIARAKALHLSGISLALSDSACDACHAAVAAARAAGVMVSFDTNLRLKLWSLDRARAIMTDMIGRADICLPSYDDIVAITGLTDPDRIADRCLTLGASIVALKLGAEGALIATASERLRLAPHPVTPVDATGAGDTFGGAFVARLVAGDEPMRAGRYAAVAAALSTEGYGAVAPIPTREAVLAAMG
jgi:2-dehydro-3-deoxygluconokinase